MKNSLLWSIVAAALVCVPVQAANLVINGDFEANTATSTVFGSSNEQINALISNFTAYGVRQGIDLQTFGSGFGVDPQSGDWKVSPASDAGSISEEFSMDLASSVLEGQTYSLEFYIERLVSGGFDGGAVEVGVSSSATSFGTLVYTSGLASNGWTLETAMFVSPITADYLTVRVLTDDSYWVGLDNFSVEAAVVPAPPALLLMMPALVALTRLRRRS